VRVYHVREDLQRRKAPTSSQPLWRILHREWGTDLIVRLVFGNRYNNTVCTLAQELLEHLADSQYSDLPFYLLK